MTPEQIQQLTELRSLPVLLDFSAAQVDAENGVIRDVVMAEEGEAKGHGVHLDSAFISDLVAFDQKHFSQKGVKVRFDHPMWNAMGSQLGRMKNVRKREQGGKMQAIADLHLLQAAKKSPTHGDMYSWVLSMADEDPEFIMSSISFRPAGYFQRKANGNKKKIWVYDEEGNWQRYDEKLGKVFVEFGEHYATDLVESGAATTKLFKEETNPAPADNPKKRFTMNLREMLFGKEKPAEDVALSAEQIQELRDKMALAEKATADAQKAITDLTAEVEKLKTSLQEKETELATAKARVTDLEAKAADTHGKGPRQTEDPAGEKELSFHSDPMTLRARKAYEAMQKNNKAA